MANKTRITQQQYDNLLEALNVMWPSVPPENVAEELCTWRADWSNSAPDCGTVACFGGWCAWWPAFRKQGVRVCKDGQPYIVPSNTRVGEYLFGHGHLFASRGAGSESLGYFRHLTDHEIVTHRLRHAIANSEVA